MGPMPELDGLGVVQVMLDPERGERVGRGEFPKAANAASPGMACNSANTTAAPTASIAIEPATLALRYSRILR